MEGKENPEYGMTSIISQLIPNSGPVIYTFLSHSRGEGTKKGDRERRRRRSVPLKGWAQGHANVFAVGRLASGSPAPNPAHCAADLTDCSEGFDLFFFFNLKDLN